MRFEGSLNLVNKPKFDLIGEYYFTPYLRIAIKRSNMTIRSFWDTLEQFYKYRSETEALIKTESDLLFYVKFSSH